MSYRAAIHTGLVYAAAITIWVLGRLASGNDTVAAGAASLSVFLVVQCLVLWVATPWLASAATHKANAQRIVLAVVMAWPVLALLLQLDDVGILRVVLAQIGLVGLCGLVYAVARWIDTLRNWQSAVLTAFQVVPAALLWQNREVWTAWVLY